MFRCKEIARVARIGVALLDIGVVFGCLSHSCWASLARHHVSGSGESPRIVSVCATPFGRARPSEIVYPWYGWCNELVLWNKSRADWNVYIPSSEWLFGKGITRSSMDDFWSRLHRGRSSSRPVKQRQRRARPGLKEPRAAYRIQWFIT